MNPILDFGLRIADCGLKSLELTRSYLVDPLIQNPKSEIRIPKSSLLQYYQKLIS